MAKKKSSKSAKAKKKSSHPPKQPNRRLIARVASGIIALIIISTLVFYYVNLPPRFNGKNAFAYIEKQCDFGPRVPGSQAHNECGDFLVTELSQYADRVSQQQFTYQDKKDSTKAFTGRNIIASFNLQPKRDFRVMLCAHWDSRPTADQDPDPANHQKAVLGANDGASGVAVLLEMAHILHHNPLDFGIDIVLFDLEDMGDHGAGLESDSLTPFCIGSQYFVKNRPGYHPRFGILLDMVGDKELRFEREGYSWGRAPQVVTKVWNAAKEVGATAFVEEIREPVLDDHVPFLEKGIKVIDIIDFDYPHWHTINDTPDKCSAESLQQVGDVLIEVLYNE